MESNFKRHILKTISYRVVGTITSISLVYYVSSSITISSIIGVGELIVKPIIYFLHERLWYKLIRIKNDK
jgi:uncharacterized membrane protein